MTVVYQAKSLPAGARKEIERAGAKVESTVPEVGVVQVKGKANLIPALRKLTGVQYVAPSITWKLQVEKAQLLKESSPDTTLTSPGDLYSAYQWDIGRPEGGHRLPECRLWGRWVSL